jgi:hypothetical protein
MPKHLLNVFACPIRQAAAPSPDQASEAPIVHWCSASLCRAARGGPSRPQPRDHLIQHAGAQVVQQQRQAFQTIGAMRAGYGNAGDTSAGSPLDAHSSSATAAELDRQDIIYNGQMRAMGYSTQEALYQTAAGTAIQQGNEATNSALIKGISGMAGQGSGLLAGGGGGATASGGGATIIGAYGAS